jgi:hypothetical protein
MNSPVTEKTSVVEREARDAEQDHPDETDGGTDPMPLVEGLEPVGAAAVVGTGGGSHRKREL